MTNDEKVALIIKHWPCAFLPNADLVSIDAGGGRYKSKLSLEMIDACLTMGFYQLSGVRVGSHNNSWIIRDVDKWLGLKSARGAWAVEIAKLNAYRANDGHTTLMLLAGLK